MASLAGVYGHARRVALFFFDVPNGSWNVFGMMHNECVNLLVNCKKAILERALLRSCWQRDQSRHDEK